MVIVYIMVQTRENPSIFRTDSEQTTVYWKCCNIGLNVGPRLSDFSFKKSRPLNNICRTILHGTPHVKHDHRRLQVERAARLCLCGFSGRERDL